MELGAVKLVLVGIAGGLIGYKLNLPAGGMIGAIFAVIIYKNLDTQSLLNLPVSFILFSQILIGITIGAGFSPDFLSQLKKLAGPAFLALFLMIVFTLLIILFLRFTTDLDIVSIILAASPGGLTEMGAFSIAFNAKPHVVLTIHLLRILAITIIIPLVIAIINRGTA